MALAEGDRVAYLIGRRDQCVVTTVERVTAAQILLTDRTRWWRESGAKVRDHYTKLISPSSPEAVSARIAMEHRRLASLLDGEARVCRTSTTAGALSDWLGRLADVLDETRRNLAAIEGDAKGPTKRGTSNTNARGGSPARRSRKQWLLDTFGDGEKAPCGFGCGAVLTLETMSVDRYPIPGVMGGRYVRGNIRVACIPCNSAHGATLRGAVTR